jgi:hypothetical protein
MNLVKDLLFEYSYLIALYGSPLALCFSAFSMIVSFKRRTSAINENTVRNIVHTELYSVRHNINDLVAKVDMLILKDMNNDRDIS